MIIPTPADIGRAVTLPCFNAPAMKGELHDVQMIDMLTPEDFVLVRFPDMRAPVRTDRMRLEWDEAER